MKTEATAPTFSDLIASGTAGVLNGGNPNAPSRTKAYAYDMEMPDLLKAVADHGAYVNLTLGYNSIVVQSKDASSTWVVLVATGQAAPEGRDVSKFTAAQ